MVDIHDSSTEANVFNPPLIPRRPLRSQTTVSTAGSLPPLATNSSADSESKNPWTFSEPFNFLSVLAMSLDNPLAESIECPAVCRIHL